MDKLYTFIYEKNKINVIMDKNMNIYFMANEVATSLGYKDANKTISKKLHKKYKRSYKELKKELNINLKKNERELHSMTTFITESGLYKLVLGSKQQNAIKFQEWIIDDVLPNLRKKGSYIIKKDIMHTVQKLIKKNNNKTIE